MNPAAAVSAFALALPSLPASACENRLDGSWQSDGAATMAFVHSKAKLEQRSEDFLRTITGHMRLTFGKGEVHTVMPDLQATVAGKTQTFAGTDQRHPWRMLFCNEHTTVWTSRKLFGEGDQAWTFHFVDADTFWVYGGSTEAAMPDLHIREFFRRVR